MRKRPTAFQPRPAAQAAALLPVLASLACGTANTQVQAQAQAGTEPATPKVQEIVITSQKRTERIKDAPVAASVVSEDFLSKGNANEIADLNKMVPSVQIKGTFNGRVPMAMRGISTNANEAAIGLTSGVAVLVDGIPVPSDAMSANELQDIARVEVLKGPQSTLGGRTASAGVINFITRTPSKVLTGSIGATLTNDHEYRLNGYVSGPINDLLGFSVSANTGQRDYPIHNRYNDEDSSSKTTGGRLKLKLTPDRDLDITLAARSASADSTGETFVYQYLTPGAALFPYFPWAPDGIAQSATHPGLKIGYGNTEYNSPVAMSSKVRSDDASLVIEKRLGGYTLSSITGYQKETNDIVQDVTAQAVKFLNELRTGVIPDPPIGPPLWGNNQNIRLTPKSLTQEFKVASPGDRTLSYVAGLFYSDVKVTQLHRRYMFVNAKNEDTASDTKTTALYGRATWNLTPAMSLLAGLRWNRDQVAYSIQSYDLGLQPTFRSAASDTSNVTVGDLTLRYKLGKDNMVYGTYARGYKPRAYNTAKTLSSNDALAPVDKEDIDHLELGAKTTLLGGALSMNAALFNTTYSDYQVQLFPPSSGVPDLQLLNAAKARTRGLELDAQLAASDRTRLTLSAAYIDAKFLQFANAPAYPGQTPGEGAIYVGNDASGAPVFAQDLSGKPMPDSPKFKFTLGVDHALPAGVLLPWETSLNANYAYRTSAYMQGNQNPQTRQPGFGILNLSATTTSPSGRYAITAFVNNALDKFYLVNAEDFFSGLYAVPASQTGTGHPGGANAVIGQPARDAKRYFGLRFNVYFD